MNKKHTRYERRSPAVLRYSSRLKLLCVRGMVYARSESYLKSLGRCKISRMVFVKPTKVKGSMTDLRNRS